VPNLAESLEAVVRRDATIWLKLAANAMRIFRQFDMIGFVSNFSRRLCDAGAAHG
jgi:hypothetical protein